MYGSQLADTFSPGEYAVVCDVWFETLVTVRVAVEFVALTLTVVMEEALWFV